MQTQASATVNHGSTNNPYGAHVGIVAGAAGTASGGTGTVTLVVSGTSWVSTTATRTPADSETIVADITAMSTNSYVETTKRWLGQVTFTLTCTGGCTHTTYA